MFYSAIKDKRLTFVKILINLSVRLSVNLLKTFYFKGNFKFSQLLSKLDCRICKNLYNH